MTPNPSFLLPADQSSDPAALSAGKSVHSLGPVQLVLGATVDAPTASTREFGPSHTVSEKWTAGSLVLNNSQSDELQVFKHDGGFSITGRVDGGPITINLSGEGISGIEIIQYGPSVIAQLRGEWAGTKYEANTAGTPEGARYNGDGYTPFDKLNIEVVAQENGTSLAQSMSILVPPTEDRMDPSSVFSATHGGAILQICPPMNSGELAHIADTSDLSASENIASAGGRGGTAMAEGDFLL
ncbi:hypothetical protein FHS85_003941 [Rhodoligotrophos appendicifer]|uniref:hypothetical protein n=1 Tax=Rhodoligotrophos appendicifer TaxID=987056 RepID=UPI0011855BEC|nr:hypothetical protein [Rhodoligotrophos appendicifer]